MGVTERTLDLADPAARLLLVSEVAAALRVAPDRVYELIRARVLPVVHIGRQVRIPEQHLRAWLDAGGGASSRATPGTRRWQRCSSPRRQTS